VTHRTKRIIDGVMAALCALVAVWSAMVTAAKIIHGVPDWWQWALVALLAARLSWVNFQDSRGIGRTVL
jgi:hypothetical protein